jgi:hypothetical protein
MILAPYFDEAWTLAADTTGYRTKGSTFKSDVDLRIKAVTMMASSNVTFTYRLTVCRLDASRKITEVIAFKDFAAGVPATRPLQMEVAYDLMAGVELTVLQSGTNIGLGSGISMRRGGKIQWPLHITSVQTLRTDDIEPVVGDVLGLIAADQTATLFIECERL